MSCPLSTGLVRFFVPLAGLGLVAACAGKPEPVSAPAPPATEAEPLARADVPAGEVEELRLSLRASEEEKARVRRELELRNGAMTSLEEENASLELELAIALEELLRIQANLKNVQSRAFAVSRIAEVRVELASLEAKGDPALADRLERADDFLDRADLELEKDNIGGAAFLAQRAGELVRQGKTISEIRARAPSALLPIVPPRHIEVRTAANLRSAPGADAERIASVAAGTKLEAVARLGEWFQVRTVSGRTLWIHRGLVY